MAVQDSLDAYIGRLSHVESVAVSSELLASRAGGSEPLSHSSSEASEASDDASIEEAPTDDAEMHAMIRRVSVLREAEIKRRRSSAAAAAAGISSDVSSTGISQLSQSTSSGGRLSVSVELPPHLTPSACEMPVVESPLGSSSLPAVSPLAEHGASAVPTMTPTSPVMSQSGYLPPMAYSSAPDDHFSSSHLDMPGVVPAYDPGDETREGPPPAAGGSFSGHRLFNLMQSTGVEPKHILLGALALGALYSTYRVVQFITGYKSIDDDSASDLAPKASSSPSSSSRPYKFLALERRRR